MLYANSANGAPCLKKLAPTAGLPEALTAEMAASLVQGTSSVQVVFLMGSCPAVVGEPPARVPGADDHLAAVLLPWCTGLPAWRKDISMRAVQKEHVGCRRCKRSRQLAVTLEAF